MPVLQCILLLFVSWSERRQVLSTYNAIVQSVLVLASLRSLDKELSAQCLEEFLWNDNACSANGDYPEEM